ncbi:hypothetical protein HI914_03592 [Erysiphe necator]|nr:hypothetical protein HI914_03592 [Erysiphe necator]
MSCVKSIRAMGSVDIFQVCSDITAGCKWVFHLILNVHIYIFVSIQQDLYNNYNYTSYAIISNKLVSNT